MMVVGVVNESILLKAIIDSVLPELRSITESEAGVHAPSKWSPKQILGHLIDSASNNHSRFVRAQQFDDMVFIGYNQEFWVDVQNYQEAAWVDLVQLWYSYNAHLARIIGQISESNLDKLRGQHTLDKIAWKPVSHYQPATLRYFILDYIKHLENHVRQIFPDYVPQSF